MKSRHPYQVAAAIAVAMSLSFAVGAVSASAYPAGTADSVKAESLVTDYLNASLFEYFPSRYVNQATEIEPLPAQF